jgi:hypothetical protein
MKFYKLADDHAAALSIKFISEEIVLGGARAAITLADDAALEQFRAEALALSHDTDDEATATGVLFFDDDDVIPCQCGCIVGTVEVGGALDGWTRRAVEVAR